MIVLDANLLIYAYDVSSPHHRAAREWLEGVFGSSDRVGIPLQSVAAFLRITTHPRLLDKRLSVLQAVQTVDSWFNLPNVIVLLPTNRSWHVLSQTLLDGNASGDLVTDAQIAATAIEFDGVVYSNDRHFARFPGLRWENPLVS